MIKKIAILALCGGIIISCGNRRNIAQQESVDNIIALTNDKSFYRFDFEAALEIDRTDTLTLNGLSEKITFLRLDNKALLGDLNFLCAGLDDDFIVSSGVANNVTPIQLFDNKGTFRKNLVMTGRGPGEITHFYSWNINRNVKELIVSDGTNAVSYSFDKKMARSIPLHHHTSEVMILNEGSYVGMGARYGNIEQDMPYLTFFDNKGNVISELYGRNNYVAVPQGVGVWPLEAYGLYQSYSGNVLFQDMFNDTIYRVSAVNIVEPYLHLHRGKMIPEKEDITNSAKKHDQVFFRNIMESEKYIIVEYIYANLMCTCIWDKTTGEMIANTSLDPAKTNISMMQTPAQIKYRTPADKTITIGILSVSADKMYCVLYPQDAKAFMPEITDYDNPIVIIAELK